MIVALSAGEVTDWFVAFYPSCSNRWLDRLIPGRFKHVNAFGWSPAARTWVLYECGWNGTRIFVFPGGKDGEAVLQSFIGDAAVLKIARAAGHHMLMRVGFWCVPAVRHLLSVSGGALLPDGLWRDCLRAGAKIVCHANAETRPVSRSAAGAGRTAERSANPAECRD